MTTQQVPVDANDMPFGDDLEGMEFDDENEEGDGETDVDAELQAMIEAEEAEAQAAMDETSAEMLGDEADDSDIDSQLKNLLAEQAKYDEAVRKHKETEAKIKQLNKEKERREQDIKELTCPQCNYYHPETKVVRPTTSGSSGRGRGAGKAFPDDLRPVCAMIVGEMRLQGSNQSVIGKKLAETFPEVYGDSDNPAVRFGTVVGTILKTGSGAWADVTGFDSTVETYGDRSYADIEAMTTRIAPTLSVEHSALVEQVVSL